MSGSRLGRGRGGRLALYGGCGAVVLFLVFLYRAATSEMAKLRELHLKCAQQQEALAAQLQVIFEYKARLEKSLAEEKSSNAAVKQELQQRASREKSLRDKDSVEAMLRFNSLQQTYKLLQTEHQDLQEECKKREKQTLDETNRLETTLQDLRSRIRQAHEEKEKALEHLKTKYLELETANTNLENKYNKMIKTNDDTDSIIEHLRKEVFQLKSELENAKRSYARSTPSGPSLVTPGALAPQLSLQKEGSQPIPAPQQQQQVSPPQPLHAPRDYRADGAALSEERLNDDANEVADTRFVQRNGNIVPADPGDVKELGEQREPNDFQQKQQKNVVERPNVESPFGDENGAKKEPDEEQRKQDVARDAASSRKAENFTVASANNGNLVSPSLGKVAPSPFKPSPPKAVKLPIGVPPIPEIVESRNSGAEEKRREEVRKREDAAGDSPPKFGVAANADDKAAKEAIVEAGNLDPPFAALPARHVGEQIVERRANDGWFRMGHGVQEIGEELNQLGRVPGLDDGQANGGDDQYYGLRDYDKEPQQKDDIRLAEGEDEGEDEGDMLDYPHNEVKQGKRE